MEIVYHDTLPSTHRYLEKRLREGSACPPLAIIADVQTDGIGSRGNAWKGLDGNLFLSFALSKSTLPDDLELASTSIYFSFIMKACLETFGSKVWLKWPNDFYINDEKVGGTITTAIGKDTILCSMGINLKNAPQNFQTIDINIEKERLVESYFLKLEQVILWKEIFSQYQIEFEKSRCFYYTDTVHQKKISLSEALLMEDGSIMIENRRVYSLR